LRDELDPGGKPGELLVDVEARPVGSQSHAFHAERSQLLGKPREPAALHFLNRELRDFLPRLFRVPGVGDEERFLPHHQDPK